MQERCRSQESPQTARYEHCGGCETAKNRSRPAVCQNLVPLSLRKPVHLRSRAPARQLHLPARDRRALTSATSSGSRTGGFRCRRPGRPARNSERRGHSGRRAQRLRGWTGRLPSVGAGGAGRNRGGRSPSGARRCRQGCRPEEHGPARRFRRYRRRCRGPARAGARWRGLASGRVRHSRPSARRPHSGAHAGMVRRACRLRTCRWNLARS